MYTRSFRRFDFVLLATIIFLVLLGVMTVYSATRGNVFGPETVSRQVIYAGIGFALLIGTALLDYRLIGALAPLAYVLGLGLLGVVLVIGDVRGGAQGWLNAGIVLVQPVEVVKIIMIIVMARYLSLVKTKLRKIPYLLLALALVAVPVGLTYIENDLGGAIIILVIGLGMIWLAGLQWRWVALMAAGGGIAGPVVWSQLQDYMRTRIEVLIGLKIDPDASFTVNQALISVGSGGIFGQGWAHGSQSQLHFLRVRHTDFVFSVIAEELGFVGSVLLIALFFVVIMRLLRIADRARDEFGRLLCCGMAILLFLQVFVNIGMNMKIMPVTGITLPFISYGGSSLITLLVGIGLAESVAMRHKKLDF